ncbi:MAG: TdeIII family type II restriction endonuclease [Brevinematia bacterium]
MSLPDKQKENIKNLITNCIRNKLENYKPESNSMPFHYRLLGKDRMALYSFMQSLNTTFGTSIFEPVAVELAKSKFARVISQYRLKNEISEGCQNVIQDIMNKLSTGEHNPSKKEELTRIRETVGGKINKIKQVKVDLFLETKEGEQYLIDLKTAKPNTNEFKSYKRNLLEWAAIVFTDNPKAKVNTIIAIPYNPYEPDPYERWTIKGMLDNSELMVGKEFWDFLGGKGAYEDLLSCFEEAGVELRSEIDEYFARFKNKY